MQSSADEDVLSLHNEEDVIEDKTDKTESNSQALILSALEAQTKLLGQVLERSRPRRRKRERSSTSSSSSSSSSSPSPSPRRQKKKRGSQSPPPGSRSTTKGSNCRRSPSPLSSDEEIERMEEQLVGSSGSKASSSKVSTKESLFETAEAELGNDEEVDTPLSPLLCSFVSNRFTKPLGDKILKKKLGDYKRPDNCPQLTAPLTNPEIWKTLRGPYKKNDTRLTNMQTNVCKATSAVAKATEELNSLKDSCPEVKSVIGHLLNAISFLGHTSQSMTVFRRDSQRYALPGDFKGICDARIEDTKFLYGNDVKKTLREAREDKRLTYSLKDDYAPRGSFSSYPRKRQPFLGRQRPYGSNHHSVRNQQSQMGQMKPMGQRFGKKSR